MPSESSPTHFLHISKTGGTALKHVLVPVAGTYRLLLHTHSVRLSDVPQGQKVFFFVRSPLERFISGFLSRQRQGRPRYNKPWTPMEEVAFRHFPTANQLAEALSDTGPLRRFAENAMAGIRHLARPLTLWLEGEQYLSSRKNDILFIGFQENMEADFTRLKALLKLPQTLSLPVDDFAAHRSPVDSNRVLSELGRTNILKWYADDCALYDFCRELSAQVAERT